MAIGNVVEQKGFFGMKTVEIYDENGSYAGKISLSSKESLTGYTSSRVNVRRSGYFGTNSIVMYDEKGNYISEHFE